MIDLLNIYEEYPFFQSILIHDYFSNLPEEKNNIVRNTLQKFIRKEKKQLYRCEHNGCDKAVINSHEISETAFLKKLQNNNQKLFVIENDFKNNSFLYHFKEKYTKSISIFPGFCKEHDKNLFVELDNFSGTFDSTFINKQALRTIKKEIVEHSKIISIAEELKKELDIIPSIKSTDYYIDFVEKIKIQKERFNRLKIIYQKIFDGVDTNKHQIVYKIFDIKPMQYFFSTVIDLSQNNDILAPIFIYKLEYENKSKFIIGYFDNQDSINLVNSFLYNNKFYFEVLYQQKKKLIFSQKFLETLSDKIKSILLQNEELNEFGLWDHIFLKEKFEFPENLINHSSQ